MRELSSRINKSLKVASSTVRFGGRTVKVCGNAIKKTIKLPAATAKKVKLTKLKLRRLQNATTKDKLKKAVAATGKITAKITVKSAAFSAKGGAKVVSGAAEAVGNVDNDTVRFAKQTYDAAKGVGKIGVQTTKTAVKATVKTAKTVRTLATKKGRRKLVSSVKRKIANTKRNVRRAQKVAKNTAKLTAKIAKAAVQLTSRFIGFLASTMPWSLIIIGVAVLALLLVYLVSNCFAATAGSQERVAGWAISPSDTVEDVYTNIPELADRMETACENGFSKTMKQEITSFCSEAATPKNIISYQIGSSSGTIYPANGADGQINARIDSLIGSTTAYSSKYYSDFMAALVVLMTRAHNTEDNFALEKFTVEDMSKLIGGLNNNSCGYGSTFFVKTTTITTGEACPGENCKIKRKPGCKCAQDKNGNYYCAGHRYCDHDHKKLTVKLQTVAEYTGKSIPEVYGFNESDAQYFNDVSSFITELLIEMSLSGGGSSQ